MFAFGENWRRFLGLVDEPRIGEAVSALGRLLGPADLIGKRFLDAGSGSGLHSLAAHRLGATVVSFDVDPQSVACTEELRRRFSDGERWSVTSGSLLDCEFLRSLGTFDIVYCWGVAHHSGDLWRAVENLVERVAEGGTLVLSIYNDQQYLSRTWRGVKRLYHRLPRPVRPILVAAIGTVRPAKRALMTTLACALRVVTLRNPLVPLRSWISDARQQRDRGMDWWTDLVDWVGGYPFEVATPEAVFRFVRDRGFVLVELKTCGGGHGCNEFVFQRVERQHG